MFPPRPTMKGCSAEDSLDGARRSHGLWIRRCMTFACTAPVKPHTPVDSVQVRRDLDSAPQALRELADEALRGNINVMDLSQFLAAVDASLSAQRTISGDFCGLGTAWLSCDTRAFLSTNSRHSKLTRNAVESAEQTCSDRHERRSSSSICCERAFQNSGMRISSFQ